MQKIAIFGCVHGDFQSIRKFIKTRPDISTIMCLGDFGFWFSHDEAKTDKTMWRKNGSRISKNIGHLNKNLFEPFTIPVHFLTGNHDQYDYIEEEISKLKDLNIFQLPRVDIFNFHGLKRRHTLWNIFTCKI